MKYICGVCVGCGLCMVYSLVFSISNTISRIFADLSHNISSGPESWHFYSDVNVQFYFDTRPDLSSLPAKIRIFYRKLVWRRMIRCKAGVKHSRDGELSLNLYC